MPRKIIAEILSLWFHNSIFCDLIKNISNESLNLKKIYIPPKAINYSN